MARPKKWLTVREAAKQLKLKVATIKQYIKTGRLQADADGRVSVGSVLDYAAGVRPETRPSGPEASALADEVLHSLNTTEPEQAKPVTLKMQIAYVLDGVGVVYKPEHALDKIRELVRGTDEHGELVK